MAECTDAWFTSISLFAHEPPPPAVPHLGVVRLWPLSVYVCLSVCLRMSPFRHVTFLCGVRMSLSRVTLSCPPGHRFHGDCGTFAQTCNQTPSCCERRSLTFNGVFSCNTHVKRILRRKFVEQECVTCVSGTCTLNEEDSVCVRVCVCLVCVSCVCVVCVLCLCVCLCVCVLCVCVCVCV